MDTRWMAISRALLVVSISTFGAVSTFSQSKLSRDNNNPYSPSPTVRPNYTAPEARSSGSKIGPETPELPRQVAFTTISGSGESQAPSAASRPVAANAASVYRIDSGDVLYIGLKNKPGSGNYFTVRHDGTIDLLLAGGPVRARGFTVDDLSSELARLNKLFENNQAEVRVREYNSHRITVSGLVDRPGQVSLQRDAMPIFAIRAQVGAGSAAQRVLITRARSAATETYGINAPGTDSVLVYPGDKVEFTAGTGNN